jgi:putative membrane protein
VTPLGLVAGFLILTMLGLLAGALTGLSPGLHVNNVAALVLATQAAWTGFLAGLVPDVSSDPETMGLLLSCFLLATAGSHAVFDFIPAVFLGAPTEDTALATLPGHRLLLVGQGAKAVALAARGALLGTAFAVIALVPLRWLLADPIGLAERFRPWTPMFLMGVLGAVLASECRGRGRVRRVLCAVWVQALAGGLGIAVLRGPTLVDPEAVLFPLFSGLFGIPSLIVGLRARPGSIPYQRLEPLRGLSREDARSALRGTIAGASVSWLPGLSGGAAATLASVGTRKSVGPSQFMVVLGAVSTSTALLSVAVLFIIHRARSGAAAAVRGLAGDLAPWPNVWAAPASLLLLVTSAVLATAMAAPLAARVGRSVARRWSRSNPRRIAALSLLAILVLLAAATGPVGIALAALSAIVGLVPVALRVRRVHLMASLLIPVLLTYLGPSA